MTTGPDLEKVADSIQLEEMEKDMDRYLKAYKKYKKEGDIPVREDEELRERATKVFSKIKERLPVGYDIYKCLDDLNFDYSLPPHVGGRTSFGFLRGPRITLNPKFGNNCAEIDFILAHEGTHARLFDGSEWLEQVVTYDIIAEMAEETPDKGYENIFLHNGIQAITDAVAYKLRDQGKSEEDVAAHLKERFKFRKEYVDQFVALDDPLREIDGRDKMERLDYMRKYYSMPYYAMKEVQKGNALTGSIEEHKFEIKLNYMNDPKFMKEKEMILANARGGYTCSSYGNTDGNGVNYKPVAL